MTIKAIFLDRDGVINKEKEYLFKIKDFEFIDGVFKACKLFKTLNYVIIIITNQSGIGRGFYSEKEYHSLNIWMLDQFNSNGVSILEIFHCPHSPEIQCKCRKPMPGMFFSAQNKYNINMEESWMIGDSERDIKAANLAGIKKTIMVRSGHKVDESKSNAMFFLDSIKEVRNIFINQ